MKILILGGSVFLGRHLVDAALARGHEVTLFNRGQHNPDLYPEIEKLRGNRDGDLAALEGRRWDAAIDTSGYLPRVVRASAELLAGNVAHLTFISSISVYEAFTQGRNDETAAVGTMADETLEDVATYYGPLKALCEQAYERAMPGRVLVIRPGLIVGPYDPTDRFTYWVYRVARGGEVLAPGEAEEPVQVIDARDLAEWNIRMVEGAQTGVYNATGPAERLSMGQMLETMRQVSESDARFVWASAAFLLENGVKPWSEMPLWLPAESEESSLMSVNITRALEAGLAFRPLAETVRDTLAWAATRPAEHVWRAGLPAEREAELLRLPAASRGGA